MHMRTNLHRCLEGSIVQLVAPNIYTIPHNTIRSEFGWQGIGSFNVTELVQIAGGPQRTLASAEKALEHHCSYLSWKNRMTICKRRAHPSKNR